MSGSDLDLLVDDFLASRDDLSVSSLRSYRQNLRTICAHYGSQSNLNSLNYVYRLEQMLVERYTARSARHLWSVCREFFRYCCGRGLLRNADVLDYHASAITETALTKPTNNTITHDQLIAICDNPSNCRDRAILWFLYSTGVRVSELLVHGTFQNLNLAARQFTIDDRVTFLCDQAMSAMTDYLATLQTQHNLGRHIFDVQEYFYYSLFRRHCQQLGLRGSITVFRDSLASRLQTAGATPEDIYYMLGLRTTRSLGRLCMTAQPE